MERFIKKIIVRLHKFFVLSKYNDSTIAEYFRKQGTQIGEGCLIVPRQLGTEPYLIKIGNHVVINQGVMIHTHDGGTWIFRRELPELRVFGPVVIEDNCFIGQNSQILPNVTIGRNSIVGAGSVVITDVPPNSIVMGVPARRLGSVKKYKEKCLTLWQQQRPHNLHPDASLENYRYSKHRDLILTQMKNHLLELFKDKLS